MDPGLSLSKAWWTGIRSAAQLAPSVFLASATASSTLVAQIIPTHLKQFPVVTRDEALSCWSQEHNNSPPPNSVSHCQRELDSPRVKAAAQALLEDAPDARSRARLLAETIPFCHLLSADPVPTTQASTNSVAHTCTPSLPAGHCAVPPSMPTASTSSYPTAHYLCQPTCRCIASCRKTTNFSFPAFPVASTSIQARNSTTTILIDTIGSLGYPSPQMFTSLAMFP